MAINFICKYFTLIFIIQICRAEVLPSDITRCHAGDTVCIAKVATKIIREHPLGHAELGMPVLEPFYLNELNINHGGSPNLNLALTVRDLEVTGLSQTTVEKVIGFDKDPAKSKFALSGSTPKLILKGKYKMSGRVLVLPINGEGQLTLIAEGVRSGMKLKTRVVERDGKTYIKIDKIQAAVMPTTVNIRLSNLFGGDDALGKVMNQFLNENWKLLWKEFSPTVLKKVEEIGKNITSVVEKYVYSDIFLPEE